uniref:Uncharacterized protein n=1 Tax=Tetraselmis sp. GSL018 TaxID=582737 RepID=A0A061RR35_9CHLO
MLAASMPPSQGHHVEDSGTLLGQSMGTSASALPSLDGSANVTAGRGSGPCPQSRSPPSARSHPPSPHRRGRSGHRPRNRSRRRSGCRTPTLQPPAASPDGAHPDAAAPLPETPRARARWPLSVWSYQGRLVRVCVSCCSALQVARTLALRVWTRLYPCCCTSSSLLVLQRHPSLRVPARRGWAARFWPLLSHKADRQESLQLVF